jgi:hypothetical protein
MPAIVAKGSSQMVFCATMLAMRCELAAGHRHEGSIRALNDFQVADDETIIERDRAKGLQPFATFLHQLNAYFSDFHGCSPCELRSQCALPRSCGV